MATKTHVTAEGAGVLMALEDNIVKPLKLHETVNNQNIDKTISCTQTGRQICYDVTHICVKPCIVGLMV